MKIGFFGISKYGMGYLRKINDVAFATSKFKKVPHIKKLELELESYCNERGIPYLGNVDANECINRCKEVDLCVFGGYDKIVGKEFLEAPKYGVINTHFGLLPENRGCNPVMWSILEGKPLGFTTYFVSEKIDAGQTIERYQYSGSGRLTSFEAYNILCDIAVDRFPDVLKRIEESVYHKAGMPNDSWIDWNWDNDYLLRFSDALYFPPYPGARAIVNGKEVEVRILRACSYKGKVGEVLGINHEGVVVGTRESSVLCEMLNT